MNTTKYNLIVDELQNRVDNGSLTLEDANRLNDLAYERYVVEGGYSPKDAELIDELHDLVEDGKVKLDTDTRKAIKALVDGASGSDEGGEESDDSEDEE